METIPIDSASSTNLVSLSTDRCPAVVAQSGEVVEMEGCQTPQPAGRLNQVAHRRWRASTSVDFLNKVKRIDIFEAQTKDNQTVLYALEVHCSRPTPRLPAQHKLKCATPVFVVERSFSAFEELRQGIQSAVSILPPCTCQYCLDLLVYIRFKVEQPRGIIKLTAGTEKRKKILAQFMNDLVSMGRRRAEKVGKRECEAQLLIPVLLEKFLLDRPTNG